MLCPFFLKCHSNETKIEMSEKKPLQPWSIDFYCIVYNELKKVNIKCKSDFDFSYNSILNEKTSCFDGKK